MEKKSLSPTILVLFGLTGDLATKKIIPALWRLCTSQLLPKKFKVIGFSRTSFSNQELTQYLSDSIQPKTDSPLDESELDTFSKLFDHQAATFQDESAFQELANKLHQLEADWGVCANKLFYLAVPPKHYQVVLNQLANQQLNIPCGGELGWSRVLLEKPFGTDAESAEQLQTLLSQHFKEEQLYRIDHYLFKEIVQGIKNFRFSNNLFENTWDNSTIEKIELRLHKTLDVSDRGSFYDSVGALRDVGQNHLLSMLAMVTMQQSDASQPTDLRSNRAAILQALAPWSNQTLKTNTFRAQYQGYTSVEGVEDTSETETYFAVKTRLTHPKWAGVPITFSAGKNLNEVCKEIVVTLHHPENCELCQLDPNHQPNQIIFRMAPHDEVLIKFWAKKPGFSNDIEERQFSFFVHEKAEESQYTEEYSKVLYSAMHGDQSLFVSYDEVKAEWAWTDPIIQAWNNQTVKLNHYQPGTTPSPKLGDATADPQTIGIVGLGKMGGNLARQLLSKNWQVHGYNRSAEATQVLESEGLVGAYSVEELVSQLPTPRTIWLMVPHQAVITTIQELLPHLSAGDTIIDGGNSPYRQSQQLYQELANHSIQFLDVGVSGGPEGALTGACIMIGGDEAVYQKHRPLFETVSVPSGHQYVGPSGAGHFVKMVHNGIEYGMMQAMGEGFEVLKASDFELDLKAIADVYNHGSVISSSLMSWLSQAYALYGPTLNQSECCSGKVDQSGEGRWTVEAAAELGVPTPIISGSVAFREASQNNPSYTGQVLTALRHMFGGHTARKK